MLMPQAAHGADVGAVTVANNWNPMVAVVGNNKVALAVKRDAAMACFELPVAFSELPVFAALAADEADAGAVAQSTHLHTSVEAVKYSNVALAVDSDACGRGELPVA